MPDFAEHYPHLAWWIDNYGWMELGSDGFSRSILRILDEGGMYFEYSNSNSLDFALQAGEEYLVDELAERFSIRRNPATGEFEDL